MYFSKHGSWTVGIACVLTAAACGDVTTEVAEHHDSKPRAVQESGALNAARVYRGLAADSFIARLSREQASRGDFTLQRLSARPSDRAVLEAIQASGKRANEQSHSRRLLGVHPG